MYVNARAIVERQTEHDTEVLVQVRDRLDPRAPHHGRHVDDRPALDPVPRSRPPADRD